MRVSHSARATHSPLFSSFLLQPPCMIPCSESVCTRGTLADFYIFFSGTAHPPVLPLEVPISRIAPRTPARRVSEESEDALPLLSNLLPIIAVHVPLQTYLELNAIIIVYLYDCSFRIMHDPEFSILVFVGGSLNRCMHRVLP